MRHSTFLHQVRDRSRVGRRRALRAAALASAALLAPLAVGDGGWAPTFEYRTIAQLGEPTGVGESVFTAFGPPIVNESGTAVFIAGASPSFPGAGLYRRSIGGETVRIVSLFGSVGGFPHGLFSIEPDTIMLNDAGHVAFVGNFSNGSGAPLNGEWLIRHRDGELEILLQPGDPAPGGPGTLSNPERLCFNAAGEVAFIARISGPAIPPATDGVFLTTPDGLREVAREGDPSLHNDGIITNLHNLSLGDDGVVSFCYGSNGQGPAIAIARSDADSLELVVEPGMPLSGGSVLASVATIFPVFNREGDILLTGSITGQTGTVPGLLVAESAGGITVLVEQGDPTPMGGTFNFSFVPIALDEDGDAVFTSPLGQFAEVSALFTATNDVIQLVAQTGQVAPGYEYWHSIIGFSPISGVNNLGNIPLLGRLEGTSGYDGIWATDVLGHLHEVARLDHPFAFAPGIVFPLSDLQVRNASHGAATGYAVMNDAREFVFSASSGDIGGLYAAILEPADCNGNGVSDASEIDADPTLDETGDGVLDECQYSCPADLSGQFGNPDATVNAADLLALLQAWGYCDFPCPETSCPADIANDDCQVNLTDLLALLSAWGDCR